MENKSVGKYILVFEPKYAYHQFSVRFKSSDGVEITKIKKFTDESYDSSKVIKKNTLGEIDKITTTCKDESEFFKKYVDSSIFSYYPGNLHNIFIGYKNNGRIYTLNCVFNNEELKSQLKFVEGSKFCDAVAIERLIAFSTDPNQNNKFLQFIGRSKKDKKTWLTGETFTLLTELNNCKISMERYRETGLLDKTVSISRKLFDKLTSYKEYRELFLLKMSYVEELEKTKDDLNNAKRVVQEAKKEPERKEAIPSYEQLSFFPSKDDQRIYQKSKNNK